MLSLFPEESIYPSGFSYTPGFITTQEEEFLLEIIQGISLTNMTFKGYTASRKTASFGFDYSFDNGKLTKGEPIPSAFDFLINKVAAHLNIKAHDFAELLVIEYPVGSVINWHRDAPPFDLIAGVSLAADCVFKLRPHEKEKQTRSATISVPVARCSLYVISGKSRSEWQHATNPVKQKRYSITLRTLRKK